MSRALDKVEQVQRKRFHIPALGMLSAMRVTLRAMLSKAVTVHYPEERMELPPRSRGVIALLEENCTVCMLCAKECPCWCIYIEGHKEAVPGRRKAVNALDRFAIDFGLCMYCGICVEVCPFDALHWAPTYEYTAYTYEGLVHEMDVLTKWEDVVLPPPELVDDADEDARRDATAANAKRAEGVAAIIREPDKRDAYLAKQAADLQAAFPLTLAPVASPAPVAAAPAPLAAAAPAPAAVATPAPVPAAVAASAAPTPNLGGLPAIDPTVLPDGLSAVERGRMKRLAALQAHGRPIPPDLVANLKHILDGMG